ncbi:serine hydrolase [Leptolyngbya sp. FACHB-261]|uniref:serine hydrolase domain-containing protein n=1 Tax=Leptolyngbya sp. FACHB-261 TaxID=2692806 RepID=UPI001683CF22|nr:serine hydrolase domain-containing protein [Leptolyngbya sp. FACHB-261]MBD2100392.1 beta-lactamase family protein [Leptolyngbya sp. FACHB-261]
MDQDLREQLKLVVQQSLIKSQTPGAAIAVHINGQAFLETGIGCENKDHEGLLSTDASFYIYSITKSLIATASLYLVGKRLLELDAPVHAYLTDLSLDTSITLRQLLSHTSGLSDYSGVPAYSEAVKANPSSPWSTETFLDLAQTQGLQFAPGKGWGYFNIGYLLLKRILERTTGLSIQMLLDQVIFSPLSLKKSFVPITLDNSFHLTSGYSAFFNGDELQDITRIYHPAWVAHSVFISTAPELAMIIDAIFRGQILDPPLVEQMSHPNYSLGKFPLFGNLGYGLGLFIDTESPYGKVTGHTGEGPGYSAAAFHFSRLAGFSTTITALVNRDKHDYGLALVYKMAHIIAEH